MGAETIRGTHRGVLDRVRHYFNLVSRGEKVDVARLDSKTCGNTILIYRETVLLHLRDRGYFYRRRLFERGLCNRCPSPRSNRSEFYCDRHLDEHRDKMRRRRETPQSIPMAVVTS